MIPFWKKTGKHSKPQSTQKRRQKAKPDKRFPFKGDSTESHEYDKRNNLLYYFQLYQIERSAILPESHTVCRYLKTILEESQKPAE